MATFTDPAALQDALGMQFSDEQLAAITADLTPGVVIAGAGTGKTTVMAARVVWLVGSGQVRPEEVLGLTFTRKAAAELAGRVAAGLESARVRDLATDPGRELIGTYDSFAAKLVNEFGIRLGVEGQTQLLTGASRYRVSHRVVRAAPGPFQAISRLLPQSIAERVLELDAQLQSNLSSATQVEHFSRFAAARFADAPLWRGQKLVAIQRAEATLAERLELLQLAEDYQELKQRLGLVEYADQLRRAVQLVATFPDVAATIRARYKVVLLDEYQDTSSAQAQLLTGLFTGATAETGRGFPVTAVGDPNQAIYGWRGAAASNIIEFPTTFTAVDGAPAKRFELTLNRRSGARILEVGNNIAASLAAGGVELHAPESTPAGAVAIAAFDTWDDERAWLAEHIDAEHAAGTKWGEMAVLLRRNAAVAQVFEVLRERGIPADIVGLGGLLHLPEIAPIVDTLRILDDVGANPSVAALLSGPRWRLGLSDLQALGSRARELAGNQRPDREATELVWEIDPTHRPLLLDAVADPGEAPLSPEGRGRVAAFHDELTRLRAHVLEPVPELVRRVISTLGIEVELLSGNPTGDAQLMRFITVVSEYVDVDGDGSLSGLIGYFDAEIANGEALDQVVPSESDSVKLMTIHRAKGLEWHTVFLPYLNDQVFPARGQDGVWPLRAELLPSPLRGDADQIPQLTDFSAKGIDELKRATADAHQRSEDRLAYVAVTRAKQRMFGSHHVWTPGLKKPRAASKYLLAMAQSADAAVGLDEISPANPEPIDLGVADWPQSPDEAELSDVASGAELVREAADLISGDADATQLNDWTLQSGTMDLAEAATVASWDHDLRLLAEATARRASREVELPVGLSASAILALRADPQQFVTNLLRPMPQPPSKAALVGERFHRWVQQRFELPPTFGELEPAPTTDELTRLIAAFEAGQFSDRVPIAVEVPFVLARGNHVLRGRIDAVYQEGGQVLLVDWKTSNRDANPLQLAIYRLAWAQANQLPPNSIRTAFYHVLSDELREVDADIALVDQALSEVKNESGMASGNKTTSGNVDAIDAR